MILKKNESISIREFTESDIADKVRWINDPENNTYLHYSLPLEFDKTVSWYEKNKNNQNRFDGVVVYEDVPVGLIGLLNIDFTNQKAEYYICLGEKHVKGKGVAKTASEQLIRYAFDELGLNKIYLYTEVDNIAAQKLFERLNFKKEGMLSEDLIYNGRKISRYVYGLLREDVCYE